MIDWDSCVLWLDSRYFSESRWWDRSKYRNDGVVNGAKWKADSFYFDGSDDYVDCGNHDSLRIEDALTAEMWMKRVWTGTKLTAWKKDSYSICYFYNNHPKFRVTHNSTHYDTVASITITDDGWHHYVNTYDRNGDKKGHIYVDGEEVSYSQQPTVDGDGTIDVNNNSFIIGKLLDSYIFRGYVLLLRLFNTAFNAEQVKLLYQLSYMGV